MVLSSDQATDSKTFTSDKVWRLCANVNGFMLYNLRLFENA